MDTGAAKALLRMADHVTLTDQPDGLDIRISAKADKGFLFVPVCFVVSLACIVGAWLLWKYAQMPMNAIKLLAFGLMGFMGGIIGLLVRLGSGGPKDQLITLRPGKVSIDRYLQGDHIIRSYDAKQAQGLFTEEGSVFVVTSIGEMQLGTALSKDAAGALAALVATHLWPGQPIETTTQPMGYSITRTWLTPSASAHPAHPAHPAGPGPFTILS